MFKKAAEITSKGAKKRCEYPSNPYLECLMDKLFLKIESEPVPESDESIPSSSTNSSSSIPKSINATDLGWSVLAQRYNIPQNIFYEFPGGADLFLKWMLWEDDMFEYELRNAALQDYFEAKAILNLSSATWLQRDIEKVESSFFSTKSNFSIVGFIADTIQHTPTFPSEAGPVLAFPDSESYQSMISTCCFRITYYDGCQFSEFEDALKTVSLIDFPTFKILAGKFCILLSKKKKKQIRPNFLYSRSKQLITASRPSSPFQLYSSNARSWLSKDLPQILAGLPKDVTLVAMGSSQRCNKQLLTMMWPYFALFKKACLDLKEGSDELPQPLDFGNRLTPKALKNLVGYFYTGTADFSHFDAKSVLLHAEELRIMDGKRNGLKGFESLVAHLILVTQTRPLTIPTEDIGYGIVLGSQDAEIWKLSIETWRANFSDTASSDSIDWLVYTDWDLFWRATRELLDIKQQLTEDQSSSSSSSYDDDDD